MLSAQHAVQCLMAHHAQGAGHSHVLERQFCSLCLTIQHSYMYVWPCMSQLFGSQADTGCQSSCICIAGVLMNHVAATITMLR